MNDLLRDKDYYTQYTTICVNGFIQTIRIKTIGHKEEVYTKDLREPIFCLNSPLKKLRQLKTTSN